MDDDHHVMMALRSLMEQVRHAILTDGEDELRPSQFRVIGSVPPDSRITVTELTRDGYSSPRRTHWTDVCASSVELALATTQPIALPSCCNDWSRTEHDVGTRRSRQFRLLLDETADINAVRVSTRATTRDAVWPPR